MKTVCYRGDKVPDEPVRVLTEKSFLASGAFASLWAARGGRRVVWAVEDGGELAAVFPGIEFGRPPIRRFASMPNGLYGRIFTSQSADVRRVREELTRSVVCAGYIKTYLFDFSNEILAPEWSASSEEAVAALVDISDVQWEPADRKLRGEIRRAEREGLAVEPFSWTRHHEGFLSLVRRTLEEHGGDERYARQFWERLAQVAEADNRVQWHYCARDSAPVSSHIYFIENELLIGWQMYYDRQYSSLKANPYLIYRACCRARPLGVRTLDLGATPKGAEGTEFFKRRWGGYDYRYRTLTIRRGIGRWL